MLAMFFLIYKRRVYVYNGSSPVRFNSIRRFVP